MNLYWPVPSDAKSNSEFHIIHFKGIDRDSDADVNELLTTRIPEELTCETVTIGGQKFVKFAVDSFSPFALLYEKDTSTPTQPSTTSAPENPAGPTKPDPTTTPKPAATPQPTVTPQPTAVQATVPQTGDTTPLMLWVVLLVISAMGLAGCLWVRFRKKHYKN